MNKKEVSEIKKQFTFSNNLFNIDKISTFFISKNAVSSSKTQRFADYEDYENGSSTNCWDEIEEVCFFDIFKKTLGGQIGKSLVEYSFPLDIIQDVDLVLIMTVNPGYGGQKFIEHSYAKLLRLQKMLKDSGSKAMVEVDGGVNFDNAEKLVNHGVNVLVAGSTVFGAPNRAEAVLKLKGE